jgi:hypothetical protein
MRLILLWFAENLRFSFLLEMLLELVLEYHSGKNEPKSLFVSLLERLKLLLDSMLCRPWSSGILVSIFPISIWGVLIRSGKSMLLVRFFVTYAIPFFLLQ